MALIGGRTPQKQNHKYINIKQNIYRLLDKKRIKSHTIKR